VEPARRLGLEPRCFAEPVLFLTGTRPGQFRVPRTRAIFDHLPGPDAYWAVIPGLNHAQFLSFFSTRAPEAGEREDNDDVVRGTRRLHATIVAFLRGYAGDDQAGWDSLVREEPIESLRADAEFTCPRDAGQG